MPKINIKILITEIFPQKNVKKEFLRLMQFPPYVLSSDTDVIKYKGKA